MLRRRLGLAILRAQWAALRVTNALLRDEPEEAVEVSLPLVPRPAEPAQVIERLLELAPLPPEFEILESGPFSEAGSGERGLTRSDMVMLAMAWQQGQVTLENRSLWGLSEGSVYILVTPGAMLAPPLRRVLIVLGGLPEDAASRAMWSTAVWVNMLSAWQAEFGSKIGILQLAEHFRASHSLDLSRQAGSVAAELEGFVQAAQFFDQHLAPVLDLVYPLVTADVQ
jgi:hypothetical protein